MLRDRRVDPTNNFEATTNPAVTDDQNEGYTVGSHWINTTTKELFVCFDATAGAAVWKEVGAGGGGGAYVETRDPNINDDASLGFDPGDFWLNTDNEVVFVCLDSTAGAAVWRDVNQKDEYQTIYVGKHGDDAQSGKTPNKAKLTITAAITAAGTPPDEHNAVVIQVVDAGRYDETISLPDFVHLWGPNADFHGRILAGADVSVSLRHHVGTGSDPALVRPSSANPGTLFYDVDELSNSGTGDLIHLLVEGVTTLRIRRMLSSHTKCVYMRDLGSGIPTVHFDVYELDCSDNTAIDAQDSRLHGRIDHIHGTAPTGKGLVLGSATVTSLTVNDLNAPTALDIATNAQADLFIGRITGTQVIANNAQARVSVARRDNLLATADPTSLDNQADGYTNGSLWINNTTKDAFICVDQVAGTWVKIQLGTGGVSQAQIVYVGKHGSDARSGANIENAKLTFGAAITAAGIPAGESSAVTIVCLDDGEYVENITHVSYVNIYAPNATLKGLQSLVDNVAIKARRLINDGTNMVVFKSVGAGMATVEADTIAQIAGVSAVAFCLSGNLKIRARYVECSAGGDGIWVQHATSAKLYVDIDEFKGGGVGCEMAGAVSLPGVTDAVSINGRIGRLYNAAVGIMVGSFGGGAAYLNIDKLDCTTAFNAAAGGKLRLFVGEISGTQNAANGADVRVTTAKRNNWLATTDPTTGDDSTDGYEIGSWWLNTTTNELYVCVNASAAAAVWREVAIGGGGGVHVAIDDPDANDDQTQGFDPGSFWFNTTKRELWTCIDATTAAAKWRNVTEFAHNTLWRNGKIVGPAGSTFENSVARYTSIQAAIDDAITEGETSIQVYLLPGSYNEDVTIELPGAGSVAFHELYPREWGQKAGDFFVSTNWTTSLTIKPTNGNVTVYVHGTIGFMGRASIPTIVTNPLKANYRVDFKAYDARLTSRGVGTAVFDLNSATGNLNAIELHGCTVECGIGVSGWPYQGVFGQLGKSDGRDFVDIYKSKILGHWDTTVSYLFEIVGESFLNIDNQGADRVEGASVIGGVKIASSADDVFISLGGVFFVVTGYPILVDGNATGGGVDLRSAVDGYLRPLSIAGTNALSVTELPGDRVRFPILVGPPNEAKYTRIQDAIDDASEGDAVWVLPGTYVEDISLKHLVDIRAVIYNEGANQTVVINGEMTLDSSGVGSVRSVGLYGIKVNAQSGSALTFSGTDAKSVTVDHSTINGDGSNPVFGGTGGDYTVVLRHSYSVSTAAPIAVLSSGQRIALQDSTILVITGDAFDLQGGRLQAFGQYDQGKSLFGRIHVVSGYTSQLMLSEMQVFVPSGVNVQVDGSVDSQSYYRNCWGPDGFQPLTKGGVNAADFKEAPKGNAGDVEIYNGDEWEEKQIAAQQVEFLVGPTGQAKYDSIQDAIDAASSGDKVWVLPGTYNENITMKGGVDLLAVDADLPVMHGISSPKVIVNGTLRITWASNVSFRMVGIRFNGPTGTDTFVIDPGVGQFGFLIFRRCAFTSNDARALFVDTTTAAGFAVVAMIYSVLQRSYTSVDGPAIHLDGPYASASCDQSNISNFAAPSQVAVEIENGGQFRFTNNLGNASYVGGTVDVSGGTNNLIQLLDCYMQRYSAAYNIDATGTLDPDSFVHNTFDHNPSAGEITDLIITGTNAAQLAEKPGDRARYKYLVGPPAQARYQTIQSAVDQAVADGYDKNNPVTVYVLDGTYTESLQLKSGISIEAVNRPRVFVPSAPSVNVHVIGNVTFNLDDPGISHSLQILGLGIQPSTGAAIVFGGSANKSISFFDSYVSSPDADLVSRAGAGTASLGFDRSQIAHVGTYKIDNIPSGSAINMKESTIAGVPSSDAIQLSGGSFYFNGNTALSNAILGRITVVTATTGSNLELRHCVIWTTLSSHVQVDGTLGGIARYDNVLEMIGRGPITIAGANATQFKEIPFATDGALRRYSDDGVTAKRWINVANNYTATADPTVNDDVDLGYAVGSWWYRTDTGEWFICEDATDGAAVWREVSTGAGGGVHVATANPTVNDDQTLGYDPGSLWVNTATQALWVCIDASTGAAVWRNTTDFGYLLPYLVGPVGLAPYQSIQAAINAAPSGTVYVLPGTYAENITLKTGVNVIAAHPLDPHIAMSWSPNVIINGTISWTVASGFQLLRIKGLRVNPPVGSSAVTVDGAAGTGAQLIIMNCRMQSEDADVVSLGATPILVSIGANFSTFNRTAGTISGPAITLGAAGVFRSLTAEGGQIESYAGTVAIRLTNDNSSVWLYNGLGNSELINGQVEVTSGSTTGSWIKLRDIIIGDRGAGSHVIVTGVLDSTQSYYYNVHQYQPSAGQPIVVTGTNASQLKERPQTDAGGLYQYDGDRWGFTQLAAAPSTYLVGPAGTAKYTTIQSAIDAAVAAGGSTAKWIDILPGTYTEDLSLAPLVYLRAASYERGAAKLVTINGDLTYNYDSVAPNLHIVYLIGLQISATSVGITYSGTAKKGVYVVDSSLSTSAGHGVVFGGTGTNNQLVLRENSVLNVLGASNKWWTVTTATGVYVSVDESSLFHSSAFSSAFNAVDLTTVQTLSVQKSSVVGGIVVSAAASVLFVDVSFQNPVIGTQGTHLTINANVAAGSGIFRSYTGDGNEVTIGGTNALSLPEFTGQYARYTYLVGAPGRARYQTIQAAINQAVADGHGGGNPAIVWILDGTYTENITMYHGIAIRAVNEPTGTAELGSTVWPVTIVGKISITYASNSDVAKVRGLRVSPTSGAAARSDAGATFDGAMEFINCRLDGVGTQVIEFPSTADLSFIIMRGCFVESDTSPALQLPEKALLDAKNTTFRSLQTTPSHIAIEATGTNTTSIIITNDHSERRLISGRIKITSGGVYNVMELSGLTMYVGDSGDHVTVNAALTAGSYFKDSYADQGGTSGLTPLVIGGTQANSLKEIPFATDGAVRRYVDDGSAVERWTNVSNKYTATADPTVNDDEDLGYAVGSWWYRTDTGELFFCEDATDGAAVWKEIGTGSGGGIHVDTVDPTVNDDQSAGYDVGEMWLNTTSHTLWVCLDNTTGAAVWRNYNNLAHLPFVVGPVGLARYQSIQTALDAAAASGLPTNQKVVYIMPGTYTENITCTTYSPQLKALVPSYRDYNPTVTIVGTITLNHSTATQMGLIIQSIELAPTAGNSAIVISGTDNRLLVIENCLSVVNGADTFDVSGMGSGWASISLNGGNHAIIQTTDRIIRGTKDIHLSVNGATIGTINAYGSDVTIAEFNNASANLFIYPSNHLGKGFTTVFGRIKVDNIQSVQIDRPQVWINNYYVSPAVGLEINVSLQAPDSSGSPSFLRRASMGEANVTSTFTGPIIGGTQAATLKELPYTSAGSVAQYDGTKWAFSQLAAQTTPYLVGPAGTAKYTTIQAAIDQAVTDGYGNSNPTTVFILPGTYSGNVALKGGIGLTGITAQVFDRLGDSPSDVKITGLLTFAQDDAGTTTYGVTFTNLFIYPAGAGDTLTMSGTSRKAISLQNSRMFHNGATGFIVNTSAQTARFSVNVVGGAIGELAIGNTNPAIELTVDNSSVSLYNGILTPSWSAPRSIKVSANSCSVTICTGDPGRDNGGVVGAIEFATGTTGGSLRLERAAISLVSGTYHIIVDGTLSAGSVYDSAGSVGTTYVPLAVSGTNANQVVEYPTTSAGSVNAYRDDGTNAKQWLPVQLASLQVDYLVGPAGQAKYTTIQSAIDQAVTDGHDSTNQATVWILPGTYTENLSLKSGINLRAVVSEDPERGGETISTTVIVGAATFTHDDATTAIHYFTAYDLRFENTGGSVLTLSGTARKSLSFKNCDLQLNTPTADLLDLSANTSPSEIFAFYESRLAASDASYQLASINGGQQFAIYRTAMFGPYNGTAFTLNGSTAQLFVFNTGASTDNETISGRIVVATATTGTRLHLEGTSIICSAASDVQLDGQLDLAISTFHSFFNCWTSDHDPIRVAGTYANQFIEVPTTDAGSIMAYFDDGTAGKQWLPVQLAAQQVDYLVGLAGEAKYTTVQAAINQAVTDGHDKNNPATVWILDGTYTENLTLQPGISLRAVNETPDDIPDALVEIAGAHTFATSLGSSQSLQFRGIEFSTTGTSPTFTISGTDSHSLTFYSCQIGNASTGSVFSASGGSITVSMTRCYVSSNSSTIATIRTGDTFWVKRTAVLAATTDSFDLEGGSLFVFNGPIDSSIQFWGRIHLVATYTSGLFLQSVFWGTGGTHVQCDGSASGTSWWVDCYFIDQDTKMTVAGANANTFQEHPTSYDGAIWRYENDGTNAPEWARVRNNYTATTDPTVNDDIDLGYAVGSWWFRTDTGEWFVCEDATDGAAVWREVATGAGGGTHVDTTDPTVNDDQTAGYDPGSLWVNTSSQMLWVCIDASTGAAVWRNTTDLAHLGKLLVGPAGFAPYQTIQSAITAAVSGQTVYVLPGTYVENLTLKDGVSVRAVAPSDPWVPGLTLPPVNIDGTLTWAPTAGFPSILLEGFDIDAPAGQSAIVINPGAGAGCILIGISCDIRGSDAPSLSLGTAGVAVAAAFHRSALGRTYTSTGGAAVVLSHSTHSLTLDDCQVYTPSGDPGTRTAINISGGASCNIVNCNGSNTLILGQINVSGGTNNTLRFRNSYITAYSGASHVVVTGTLNASSYWHEVTAMASPSGIAGEDITITGPNAATFLERPSANAGSIRRYNGNQWKSVRNNYTATSSPTVNDDTTQGYAVGSEWYDTSADIWWKCEDATTGAAVWEKGMGGGVDQVQVIYVGKHGSDAADGKTPDKAKLTIGAAITAAGTPVSEAAAVTVCVVDDGEYAQDITLPSYVNLYAPSATIKGRTRINAAVHLRARRLIDNGTNSTIERLTAGTLPAFVDCDYIENLTSSVMAFFATGTTYFRAGKTKHGAGTGVSSTIFTGDTKVIVDIGEMECGASAALIAWGSATYKAELHGRVGKIIGTASSIGIDVLSQKSEAYLTIEEIDCTTAFQVAAAATNILRLFVGQSSGTETIGAGADVHVTRAGGLDAVQTIYVGKNGNDNLDGLTRDKPKLTIGAAITAAGTPAGESTAVTVEVIDNGEYTEDLTGVAWVNIYAPNARIVSTTSGHTMGDNMRWVFGSMHSAGTYVVQKSSTGYAYLKVGKLSRVGTNNRPIDITGGTLEVDVDYVVGTAGIAGAAVTGTSAKVIARVGFAEASSGTSALFLASSQGAGAAEVDATIERAEVTTAIAGLAVASCLSTGDSTMRCKFGTASIPSGIGFQTLMVSTGVAKICAEGERLSAGTAYTIFAGSVFRLLVGELSGTETIANGADARVTKAKRDNYVATTDPTANDDSTDGYTVGSVWINTSTDRIWVCVDATATAAIWNVVPNGGEVQLQTIGSGTATAVTIPLVDPETVSVHAYIVARRTDSVDAAAYERRAAFYRNGGGATRITFVDTPFTRETDATWNVDLVASGNNALIQVTGGTGATIEWRVRYTLERM